MGPKKILIWCGAILGREASSLSCRVTPSCNISYLSAQKNSTKKREKKTRISLSVPPWKAYGIVWKSSLLVDPPSWFCLISWKRGKPPFKRLPSYNLQRQLLLFDLFFFLNPCWGLAHRNDIIGSTALVFLSRRQDFYRRNSCSATRASRPIAAYIYWLTLYFEWK